MIKEIEKIAENPFSRYLEYYIDNKKIGYLRYALIYDRMEIEDLFVDESYRNQKGKTRKNTLDQLHEQGGYGTYRANGHTWIERIHIPQTRP